MSNSRPVAPHTNSQLRTLTRTDADFSSYLLGTFSKTERAIPLQTLNANSQSEQVTFKIVPLREIQQPSFFAKWIEVFKFRSFILVGFPIFVILANNLFDETPMDPTVVICSVLASFAILVGANLLNDYFDHMRGLDRIHPDQQRKPIQKGWVTAQATKTWALVYLILGIFLGLPAVFMEPTVLWLILIPTAAALGAWLTRQKGLKFRRGAESLIFLLSGPLLTVGFQLAVSGIVDLEALWIGVLTGWFSVFLVHLKNFESLMVNAQAGLQSTVVRLGFDKSRKLLSIWWTLFLANLSVFHFVYASTEWAFASFVVPPILSIPFFKKIHALSSPVGSEINQAVKTGRTVAMLVLGWWLLETLWVLVLVDLGG